MTRTKPAVLVLNTGSSSIKFSLICLQDRAVLISGQAQKLGLKDASLTVKINGGSEVLKLGTADHAAAMEKILQAIDIHRLSGRVSAVGHRVVHGGEKFREAVIINEEVIRAIEQCVPFAPLHNPADLMGIAAARRSVPHLPHVAVFDTAFHQTLPEYAYLYAVPKRLYRDYGVRRYGFHGTSHRYVTQEAARLLGIKLENSAFISAHLGNGASAAAVLNGKSVDTTMGLTPLEGLVMGTRSGDIDPGMLPYIAESLKMTIKEVINLLNTKSGLLGVSELSSDVRELQEAAAGGHAGAVLALDVFAHRLAKYIGALTVSLPRVDALIFTGGIGENSALVRAKVLRRLGVLGYRLDSAANQAMAAGKQGLITTDQSTRAMVINTNEELMIALDTATLL
ncbi:MAG: acetate kinase [Elusimicrobia bacterium RIFOXYA12_FULL_57_11]|nr:MAG: acetate kinase [Elusimicrobia bacterium RIFOXYA12_FULL_57_11]